MSDDNKSDVTLNMRILKPSRKKPRVGDVFVYQMPDGLYRYGRVVKDDADVAGFHPCLLLYFYCPAMQARMPIPTLKRSALLIPPVISTRAAWTIGYFQTVMHGEVCKSDILDAHCFWDHQSQTYVDEYGRIVGQRIEPCGFYAVSGYGAIDWKLSDALGIPLPYDPYADNKRAQETKTLLKKVARSARGFDLEKCTTAEFRRILAALLNDLERIGEEHGELYDTDVREQLAEAVFFGFVLEKRGYELPREYGMFSEAGNAAVCDAVRRFVEAAQAEAARAGTKMNIPAKRLRALEDPTVETAGGEGYDTFLGASL